MAGALALAAPLAIVHRPLLEVRLEEGPSLVRVALAPDEPFVLTYRHSVTREPVREVYALGDAGAVRVLEHAYRTPGAGLGPVEGEGRRVEAPGGWTRIVGLNRPVGAFALRVGQPPVDHRLRARGREVLLSQRAAGERAWVQGQSVPLLQWLLYWRPAEPEPPLPWEESL